MTSWIPESLQRLGPAGIAWWQWIAMIAAVPVALALGSLIAQVFRAIGHRVSRRTTSTVDDELVARMFGPTRLLCAIGLLRVALPFVDLPRAREISAQHVLLAALAFALVWGALRGIDVLASHAGNAAWVRARPSSRALLALLARTGKVVVVVIALLGLLGTLGLPVGSLLAGLGIGGIALAFGAQKTVENLFGAFALGVDQPLREGDFVKIENDVTGTVESVGLRSTRLRTMDRTVVTLPNGRLADMRIETFAARDRCRLATTLGLVYGTTGEQLRAVLAGCEKVLRDHPLIWPDDVIVRFASLGASSLDIEIVAWFRTAEYSAFREARQTVLLGFLDVVEKAGTSFAFPTRTVHLVSDSQPSPSPRR